MAWFGNSKKITVAATSPKIFHGAVISLFSFLCRFDQDKSAKVQLWSLPSGWVRQNKSR